MPVRLPEGAAAAFYVAGFAALSASAWLRVRRHVALYCVSVSVACAPQRRAHAFFVPAHRPVSCGWLHEEDVSLMVYRALDVVRQFFLGESVPDWAARGVADRGQRANVAHLEATTVALNARR